MLAGSARKGGVMWSEQSADLCRTSTRRRSRGRRIPDIDPTVGENYWSIRQLSSSRSAAGWINSRQEPDLISFEPTGSPQQERAQKENQSLENQPENSLLKVAVSASFAFTSANTFKIKLGLNEIEIAIFSHFFS